MFAATSNGVAVREGNGEWRRLSDLPDGGNRFVVRLFLSKQGQLAARVGDSLWKLSADQASWSFFNPPEVDRAFSVLNCCELDAMVATDRGLWAVDASGQWQRSDEDEILNVAAGRLTDLIEVGDGIIAAGENGLIQSVDRGRSWTEINGLRSVVSDLLAPAEPGEPWLAGTATGVYRSDDSGQTWHSASPAWNIQAMARGGNGRVFLATGRGIWSATVSDEPFEWLAAQDLEGVRFFSITPDPDDDEKMWAGTWGNDIGIVTGIATGNGVRVESLGNGLETLSVLDILHHRSSSAISVATIEGVYQSQDGGESWGRLPGPLVSQTVYSLHEDMEGTLWAGAADGLWRSPDMGRSWTRNAKFGATSVIRLGDLSLSQGQRLLWAGAETDGFWYSVDRGQEWRNGGLDGRSLFRLVADPDQPGRLIAATDDGLLETAAERYGLP